MDSEQEVEIDIPRYFYKFRSFNDDHLKLLQQNELYFPSPNKFDDPYDCRIPIRYDCEAPEDKRYSYWKQFNETHYPQWTPIEIEALTNLRVRLFVRDQMKFARMAFAFQKYSLNTSESIVFVTTTKTSFYGRTIQMRIGVS
jgi:hypothetical protein